MATSFIYTFEWDPEKAVANRRKHGVSFEHAATVFKDPLSITIYDEGHSEEEVRWITMGRAANGQLLVVVHTYHEISRSEAVIRLISARQATPRERRDYEQGR